VNVTLYCTWRPSALHTGPRGQVSHKCKQFLKLSVGFRSRFSFCVFV